MKSDSSQAFIRTGVIILLLIWACGILRARTDYLDNPLPSAWNDSVSSGISAGPAAMWWKAFGDPMLDSLIEIGEKNNYDIALATRRIAIARSQAGQARSAYLPQLSLSVGWSRNRLSGRTTDNALPATVASSYAGTVTMDWEIDLFGKITAQVKQANAEVKVSAAEYAGVIISLDAEIAAAYIQLLVSRGQLDVAKRHSLSQKHIVEITEARHEAGLASKLDVAQARTVYYSTISQIPLLESSIESSYNSLGVLLGIGREGLPEGIYASRDLPYYEHLVDLGAPVDLIRRRPDIVQAEKAIDASAAALGVAKKEYLPSLTLSGSIGTQAHKAKDLFKGDSFTYSVVPTLSWTIFDGLDRRYQVASARESMKASVDSYNLAVLTAVEEVRDAIARYEATVQYIASIKEVVGNSAEELRLSVDLYKQGLSDFTNVVDAQLNYLTYQNTLVSAQGQALTSLIDLYKALGGGWDGSLGE